MTADLTLAAPAWRDREDHLARYTTRPLLWVGRLSATVHWSWSPPAIVMPLRGRVLATSRNLAVDLAGHDVFVVEAGAGLRLDPVPGQDTVVVVQWLPQGLPGNADLLPACHRQDLEFALVLSRRATQPVAPAGAPAPELDALLQVLAQRQGRLAAGIDRCPGRSQRHRRQLSTRLLRARNLIDHGPPAALDLAALAAAASLSPSHFLRLFHRVFDVSPHRYLVQQRLERARRLVVESTEPIGQIAQRMGFVNRCAFARLFKQHFGQPATRLRRQSLLQARRQLARPVVLTLPLAGLRA